MIEKIFFSRFESWHGRVIILYMENTLQLKLMIIIRLKYCTQNIQQSFMSPWEQSTADKNHSHSWRGLQSPNLGIPLLFLLKRGIKLTQTSKLIICLKRCKTVQRWAFHLPRWSTVPQLNKNTRMVQTSLSNILE